MSPIRVLSQFPAGTLVALGNVGNGYRIVDEIEEASYVPFMARGATAKVCVGSLAHVPNQFDAGVLSVQ